MSCQLDSGGKRLTSDHLETVTSPLFRPDPSRRSPVRLESTTSELIFSMRARPPPPIAAPQGAATSLLGQFRSSSSTRCCSPFRRLGHGWDPGRQRSQPRPSPSSPPHAAGLLAPERDMWRVTLLQLSQPTNLGSAPSAPPDRHVSAAPAGLPACHFRLRCSQKVRLRGKKKAPYLPSSPGPKSPGSSGLRVISVQNQRPAMLPFQPGGQEKPQNLLFLGSRS